MNPEEDIGWCNYLADQIWNSLPANSLKVRHHDQFNFRCPICGDSKKNLTKKRGFYYVSTASYHCFNCETSLNGLSFLKRIAPENIFHDALVEYDKYKLNSFERGPSRNESTSEIDTELIPCQPIPAWKVLVDNYNWNFPTQLTPEALNYLKSRKVDSFNEFLSIKDSRGVPYILILYKYFNDCIFYQVHNYTGAVGTNGQKIKYTFPNSLDLNEQEKPVFNIDNIDPSWPYIICVEGVYDALSFHNGVALGGRTITDYQKKLLLQRWPHHELVFAFDNDNPGKMSMRKLSAKYGSWKFLDINDLLGRFHLKDANEFVSLSDKAAELLKNKKFLEKNICSGFEMNIKLSLK